MALWAAFLLINALIFVALPFFIERLRIAYEARLILLLLGICALFYEFCAGLDFLSYFAPL